MPAPLLRGTHLRSIGNGGEVAPTVLLHGVCAVAGARAAAGGREPGSMLLRSVGGVYSMSLFHLSIPLSIMS